MKRSRPLLSFPTTCHSSGPGTARVDVTPRQPPSYECWAGAQAPLFSSCTSLTKCRGRGSWVAPNLTMALVRFPCDLRSIAHSATLLSATCGSTGIRSPRPTRRHPRWRPAGFGKSRLRRIHPCLLQQCGRGRRLPVATPLHQSLSLRRHPHAFRAPGDPLFRVSACLAAHAPCDLRSRVASEVVVAAVCSGHV